MEKSPLYENLFIDQSNPNQNSHLILCRNRKRTILKSIQKHKRFPNPRRFSIVLLSKQNDTGQITTVDLKMYRRATAIKRNVVMTQRHPCRPMEQNWKPKHEHMLLQLFRIHIWHCFSIKPQTIWQKNANTRQEKPLLWCWSELSKRLSNHCPLLLPMVSFHSPRDFTRTPIAIDTIHSRHKIQRTQDGSDLKAHSLRTSFHRTRRFTNKTHLKESLEEPLALHVKYHGALMSN